MKNIRYQLFIFAIAVFAVASVTGCGKKQTKEAEEIPEVDVAEAYTDSVVLYNTYPGTIKAGVVADVVGRVNGQLLTQNFKSGDFVNKGQLLFTIESTTYRDAVQRAEAALSTARSEYAYYSKQYDAMNKALQADAVSKMEVLQAKNNMDQAAASIKDSEAALRTARANLSYCSVTAPISGYISAVAIDPGNFVSGGASPMRLATIYDNSRLTAVFSLSDSQYEELLGSTGGISSNLYRHVPLKFRQDLNHDYFTNLVYEAPNVNSATGTITLKGKLENYEDELKDGMYVTVSLPFGSNPKAVLVKDAAISTDQLGKYMYTLNDSDKVVYTPVKLGGLYQDTLRVINSGITPGTRYVTKALLTVREGEKVKPRLTGKSASRK